MTLFDVFQEVKHLHREGRTAVGRWRILCTVAELYAENLKRRPEPR